MVNTKIFIDIEIVIFKNYIYSQIFIKKVFNEKVSHVGNEEDKKKCKSTRYPWKIYYVTVKIRMYTSNSIRKKETVSAKKRWLRAEQEYFCLRDKFQGRSNT